MSLAKQKALLVSMLSDSDPNVRNQASASISVLEIDENLDSIMRALGSDDRSAQAQAVYALRDGISSQCFARINDLLVHNDEHIRAAALRVANEHPRTVYKDNALILLRDKSSVVAVLAAELIPKIADHSAEEMIVAALREAPDEAKAKMLETLALIHSEHALKLAVKATKAPNPLIRTAAAKVLGMVTQQ